MMQVRARRVGEALARSGRSLAAAESCTGGGFCAAITDIPGSSAYFLGGVVAYSNASKIRDLGVAPSSIETRGAVSGEVALAMAGGARRRFRASVGVGITGIAGPCGGTREKPAGTVYLGISAGKVRRSYRRRFPGDRETVRRKTIVWALDELLAVLEGRSEREG